MKRKTIIFVNHILENINDIENFSKNLDIEDFKKDKLKQNAIIRSLEVIGEAVKNIPSNFKANYPEVPWKDIAGMRDKLMHQYFGINFELVWITLKEEIPILKSQILKIKDDLGNK